MKTILSLLAVALLIIAVAPATQAQVAANPTTVWMDDPNLPGTWPEEWEYGDPTALARLLRMGVDIDSSCNKKYWYIPVNIHASIAQWSEWSLSHQGWLWEVKKPGCYAGNSISFKIASNGDILIDYSDFNNLTAVVPNGHDEEIETFYSWGESITGAENHGWTPALELNESDDLLDETALNQFPFNLHDGLAFKLWNKICVSRCNTACEYHDTALITIVLQQQKPWLDDQGNWLADNTAP